MKLPALSLLLLPLLAVCLLAKPQKNFSEVENRALQTWRAPSWESLANGSFSEDLRSFYTDQFPFRSAFLQGKAWGERLLGRRENNGILYGTDGYLIPKNECEDLSTAKKNLAAIQDFEDRSDTPVTVLIVPRSVDVSTAYLPSVFDDSRATRIWEVIDGTEAVLPLNELKSASEAGEAVWFKTDHHWTARGAYLAYVALADALNYTPYPEDFFDPQCVSTDFLGTSYSSVGGIAEEADSIVLYRYEGDEDFLRTNGETDKHDPGFYQWTALSQKDQYRVFLGGNTALLTVRDPLSAPKPRLLLIKDSFSNALVPFLALHFDLDLVDPRYYQGTVEQLTQDQAYDRILIQQGADTLATDPSLSRFLYGDPHSSS